MNGKGGGLWGGRQLLMEGYQNLACGTSPYCRLWDVNNAFLTPGADDERCFKLVRYLIQVQSASQLRTRHVLNATLMIEIIVIPANTSHNFEDLSFTLPN
jgi:hypothetical protein